MGWNSENGHARLHPVMVLSFAMLGTTAGCSCTRGYELFGDATDDDPEINEVVVDIVAEVGPPDLPIDTVEEIRPDPIPDPIEEPVEDLPFDPMPDGRTGRLEPEFPDALFGTESGRVAHVHSGWILPAAYSGSIYELILDEEAGSDAHYTGLYVLPPGGVNLGSSWLDTELDVSGYGSICWTGDVFIAVLPTPGVGVRLLTVSATGALVRPVEVLGASTEYTISGWGDATHVFCPATGPFVVDRFGSTKIYPLNRDGTAAGGPIPTDVPTFGVNGRIAPCTETDMEGVCGMESGLVFLRQDGSYRLSDPLPPGDVPCTSDCDVAFTGSYVALIYPGLSTGVALAFFTLFALDGTLLVPPTAGHPIGSGPLGFHAASSGDTVLVVTEGDHTIYDNPLHIHLFDLLGTPMCEPEHIGTWRGAAAFWEGDAYAVLTSVWPDMEVRYRRYRIAD